MSEHNISLKYSDLFAWLREAEEEYRQVEDGIQFQETLEPGGKEAEKGKYAPHPGSSRRMMNGDLQIPKLKTTPVQSYELYELEAPATF